MGTRRWSGLVTSLLILAVVVAGCAKRPATTTASVPAPTGAAGSAPATTSGGSMPASQMQASETPATTPSTTPTAPIAGARPATKEFVSVPELKDVFFDFDKYDIRPNDAKTLDANASWLKSNGNMLVLIEGHCDERGTNEYNLALGERRAKATMNYLVSQGVQASLITIISYGEERPVCSEKNETCWAQNRRSHFLVKPR